MKGKENNMNKPTKAQLDLICKLMGTSNVSDAWREIGNTLGGGPTQAKKYATVKDASRTIDRLKK